MCFDRSVQTDERAEPVRTGGGIASDALAAKAPDEDGDVRAPRDARARGRLLLENGSVLRLIGRLAEENKDLEPRLAKRGRGRGLILADDVRNRDGRGRVRAFGDVDTHARAGACGPGGRSLRDDPASRLGRG